MSSKAKLGVLGTEGNSAVQERLFNYLRGGRVHPAVILGGPKGSGKLNVAKQIAKFFLCTKKAKHAPPCLQCSSCLRVDREVHPDLLLLASPEEEIIKIDVIREYCHQMELGPMEGKAKVCIIDECHRMNAAAANAFLKTLEEPKPDHYFWLLTSQPAALLPTVLSRCLKFYFRPDSPTASAEGSEIELKKLFEEMLATKDCAPLIAALSSKEKALSFVHFLQEDLMQSIMEGQKKRSLADCFEKHDRVMELESRLRSNANYSLMLENFLVGNFLS